MIKLSIITVNLDNKTGLEKTMSSLEGQTFSAYEYIVVDGNSQDGSKDLITNNTKVGQSVIEADQGVYHAMNKGIAMASGEYILFLNSGDSLYEKDSLTKVIPHLHTADIVYGNLLIQHTTKADVKKFPAKLSFEYFLQDTIPHSGACFIRSDLFKKVGLYDEQMRITADWMFYLNAIFRHNASYLYVDEVIGVFDFNGLSSKPENQQLLVNEKKHFLETQYSGLSEMQRELNLLRETKNKYQLLLQSGFVKSYLALRKFFGK